METLSAFFEGSPWLFWVALGMVVAALEMATGSLFLAGPALAAFLLAVLTAVAPELSLALQLTIFAGLTAALTFGARGWAAEWRDARRASGRTTLNNRAAQLAGRRASALGAFEMGAGSVRVGDTQWAARLADGRSDPVADGDQVVIEGIEGATLIVRRG